MGQWHNGTVVCVGGGGADVDLQLCGTAARDLNWLKISKGASLFIYLVRGEWSVIRAQQHTAAQSVFLCGEAVGVGRRGSNCALCKWRDRFKLCIEM